MAAAVSLALVTTANAAVATTVDFEGLAEGSTVSALSNGSGISGGAVSGAIVVFADRTGSDPTVNDAMIFDADCDGGPSSNCTGGDDDLFQPGQGNVLIISDNNDAANPNDAFACGTIDLDFAGFDSADVKLVSLKLLDTEEAGLLELFDGGIGGAVLASVVLPVVGDGGISTIAVNVDGADAMRVTLGGSGAIDDLQLETETEEEIDGWMTGGGNITNGGRGRNAELFSTHGFIIRCDASFARFQYNDHLNGGNFHLEDVTSVDCSDAAGINPHPPRADFDTLTMVGTGRWNGVSGATVVVTMTDTGQPAREDNLDITVWDKDGNIVSDRQGNLTVGNHQAH